LHAQVLASPSPYPGIWKQLLMIEYLKRANIVEESSHLRGPSLAARDREDPKDAGRSPFDLSQEIKLAAGLPFEDSLHLLDESGPVFIMGCPRSGTTVLADSLGLLPNAILKIGIFMPDRTMHLLGSGMLSPACKEHLLWAHRYSFWRAFIEMHGSGWSTLRDMVRTLSLKPLRRRKQPLSDLLFIYKEPFLNFACEDLARHFSKAKFIHIVRDGRDCADSMVRTYPHALSDDVLKGPLLWRLKGSEIGVAREWRGWNLPWWLEQGAEEDFLALPPFARYVWMWKVMVCRGQALATHIEPERFLEVRYEAFCDKPLEVGERILQFLKAPTGGAYKRFLRRVTPASVGCHRRRPKELLAQSERIGSPLLGELGYL
jgi:hypothetical protein